MHLLWLENIKRHQILGVVQYKNHKGFNRGGVQRSTTEHNRAKRQGGGGEVGGAKSRGVWQRAPAVLGTSASPRLRWRCRRQPPIRGHGHAYPAGPDLRTGRQRQVRSARQEGQGHHPPPRVDATHAERAGRSMPRRIRLSPPHCKHSPVLRAPESPARRPLTTRQIRASPINGRGSVGKTVPGRTRPKPSQANRACGDVLPCDEPPPRPLPRTVRLRNERRVFSESRQAVSSCPPCC